MRAFSGRLPSETRSNDVRRGQIGPRVLRFERITPRVADCDDRSRRDPRLPMRARLRNCSLELSCRSGQISPPLSGLHAACEGRVALRGRGLGRIRPRPQTGQSDRGRRVGRRRASQCGAAAERLRFFGATKSNKLEMRRVVEPSRKSSILSVCSYDADASPNWRRLRFIYGKIEGSRTQRNEKVHADSAFSGPNART